MHACTNCTDILKKLNKNKWVSVTLTAYAYMETVVSWSCLLNGLYMETTVSWSCLLNGRIGSIKILYYKILLAKEQHYFVGGRTRCAWGLA